MTDMTEMTTPEFIARKAKVKDMRAVRKITEDSEEYPFLLAERCITKADGSPITADELNEIDMDVFNGLISQIMPRGKNA